MHDAGAYCRCETSRSHFNPVGALWGLVVVEPRIHLTPGLFLSTLLQVMPAWHGSHTPKVERKKNQKKQSEYDVGRVLCTRLAPTNHESPTTNRHQPPPTANRQSPPTANRQPPTANRQHVVPAGFFGKTVQRNSFFFFLKDRPAYSNKKVRDLRFPRCR